MAILGNILQKGIKLRDSLAQDYTSPFDLQKQELSSLLIAARRTKFGKQHLFTDILESFRSSGVHTFYDLFKTNVPTFDYEKINDEWWHRTRNGESGVVWPGKTKFFALSSGTSGASSKYIPITNDMIRSIRKAGTRHIYTLSKYELDNTFFETGILMIGGTTLLQKDKHFEYGDLSGITTGHLPLWIQGFSKPGPKITRNPDWSARLEMMVEEAPKWNIGVIAGVPAWVQILLEKIITRYNLQNIHEIWPNFQIFVHGGVAFEPYRKGFDTLLGHPIHYIETYLASEGFFAFQSAPEKHSMRLLLNNSIFYEFVPFNDQNFNADGEMVAHPEAFMIDQIEENVEYAMLISTCAGAWRYLVGDTVKLVNKHHSEIVITGRTKHFLSLCGEHVSVDNLNKTVEHASDELGISIKEFTVIGVPEGKLFAHHWYVGSDDVVDENALLLALDTHLKLLNDDYVVERKHALTHVYLTVLPSSHFYEWMKNEGKEGGQSKFPRVLKKEKADSWQTFLAKKAKQN